MPATATSVVRSLTVPVGAAQAFEIFTSRMNEFWPREHHIGAAEMAEAVLEPRAGGRWYEKGVDGSECEWGRVATWEPPARLVILWQISREWQYDPTFETEVEVTFTENQPGTTTVQLEHRQLDRFGDGFEKFASGLGGDTGWGKILAQYAALMA